MNQATQMRMEQSDLPAQSKFYHNWSDGQQRTANPLNGHVMMESQMDMRTYSMFIHLLNSQSKDAGKSRHPVSPSQLHIKADFSERITEERSSS